MLSGPQVMVRTEMRGGPVCQASAVAFLSTQMWGESSPRVTTHCGVPDRADS